MILVPAILYNINYICQLRMSQMRLYRRFLATRVDQLCHSNILFEDNHILIVRKPHGILSQKDISGDIPIGDLVNKYLTTKYNKPGNAYVGLIHRLDRFSSGGLVIGKTSKATSRLSQVFRDGLIEKEYLCVVSSSSHSTTFPNYVDPAAAIKEANTAAVTTIESWMRKDDSAKKMTVHSLSNECNRGSGFLYCKLSYQLLANFNLKASSTVLKSISTRDSLNNNFSDNHNCSLLKVVLDTGRKHQIRAQLASIGYPVFGDSKYGSKISFCPQSIALHSYRLAFIHPTTKSQVINGI